MSRGLGDVYKRQDQRVSVGHGLVEGKHVMCYACGWPVSARDQQDPDFEPGVQCPNCANEISDERKRRFAERQAMWEKQGRVTPKKDTAECPSASSVKGTGR